MEKTKRQRKRKKKQDNSASVASSPRVEKRAIQTQIDQFPRAYVYTPTPLGVKHCIKGFTIDNEETRIFDDGFDVQYHDNTISIDICIVIVPLKDSILEETWEGSDYSLPMLYWDYRKFSLRLNKETDAICCRVFFDSVSLEVIRYELLQVAFVLEKTFSVKQVKEILIQEEFSDDFARKIHTLATIAKVLQNKRTGSNNSYNSEKNDLSKVQIVQEFMRLANGCFSSFLIYMSVPFLVNLSTKYGRTYRVETRLIGSFSSPSRRFADAINQKLLLSCLQGGWTLSEVYLHNICGYLNRKKTQSLFLSVRQKNEFDKLLQLSDCDFSIHIRTITSIKDKLPGVVLHNLLLALYKRRIQAMDCFRLLFMSFRSEEQTNNWRSIDTYILRYLFYSPTTVRELFNILKTKQKLDFCFKNEILPQSRYSCSISVMYKKNMFEVSYIGFGSYEVISSYSIVLLLAKMLNVSLPKVYPKKTLATLDELVHVVDANYVRALEDIAFVLRINLPRYYYFSKNKGKGRLHVYICSFTYGEKIIRRQTTTTNAFYEAKQVVAKKVYDHIVELLTLSKD